MNSINNWLKTIKGYLNLVIGKVWAFLILFLEKVIGKERLGKAAQAYENVVGKMQQSFNDKFETDGAYFPVVKKIYLWSARILIGIAIYLFCIETNFLWLTGSMPSLEQLQNPKVAQSSTILTADGVEIGKFFAENRTEVDSFQISPWVYKALIATEDVRFYKHSGIDLRSLGGVALGILSGGERGGGSTISQQLAKNLYNTRKKEMRGLLYYIPVVKTIIYKSKEWITAIGLERRFSKGEIMTKYLNTVDYGNNAYGIKTAAKTYFNKDPDKLTIEEAAVLVGLQKGTTLYNPIKNPKNALKRRNTVLQLMAKGGYIPQAKADELAKTDIKLDINLEDSNDGSGTYFKVALAKYVEKWAKDNDIEIDLYRDGLKIYTTIDSKMQTHAENAVAEKMKQLQREFDAQWRGKNPWIYETGEEIPGFIDTVAKRTAYYKKLVKKYKGNTDSVNYFMNQPHQMRVFSWEGDKDVMMSSIDSIKYYKRFLQCGMMAMDPFTGFVKAWVGGIDYDYFKYDHVKQGRRQPGSTFKPFVYTTAIDGPLNLSPCDKRKDEPFKKEWVENGEEKVWEPKNATGSFTHANLTLRRALARSVNSIAAALTDEVAPKKIIEYARKMGITAPLEAVGSLGLGTSDVSLYEMVAAYGIFANNGTYTEPMLVLKIEDAKGKSLFEFEPKRKEEVIKPESAFLMQYMLRGGVEEPGGTGHGLFNYGLFYNGGQVAGKTGTTSNYSDAWYIGFTKDLVCGVWVGGDDRSIHFRGPMGEGGHSALPIFGRFMEKVYADKSLGYKLGPFPKPDFKIEKDYEGCFSDAGYGANVASDSTSVGSDSSQIEAPRKAETADTSAVKN